MSKEAVSDHDQWTSTPSTIAYLAQISQSGQIAHSQGHIYGDDFLLMSQCKEAIDHFHARFASVTFPIRIENVPARTTLATRGCVIRCRSSARSALHDRELYLLLTADIEAQTF